MKRIGLIIVFIFCAVISFGQQIHSGGINIATGFKLSDPQPIDDRYVVQDSLSLLSIPNIYTGLWAYSLEDSSVFVYDGIKWERIVDMASAMQDRLNGKISITQQPFIDTSYDYQIVSAEVDTPTAVITLGLRNGGVMPPEPTPLSPAEGLANLKYQLTNALNQYLGIVLIGNSITWGMSATGYATIEPRTGALTDPRNNDTSRSWANLLHNYLGKEYYNDDTVTATASDGVPSGVNIFEYTKKVELFPGYPPFISYNNGGNASKQDWKISNQVGSKLGYAFDATVLYSNDSFVLSWAMTGYEFEIEFAALTNGAKYELFVNGESQGIYSTQAGDLGVPVAFGYTRTHSFGSFLKDAIIEIKVIPGDVSRFLLRIESINIYRKLRVTNQGIIGTTANRYMNFVNDALSEGDQFAIVSLGVNDRAQTASTGQPRGASTFRKNMESICNSLDAADVQPIIMTENAQSNNTYPFYFYDMSEVRAQLYQLAKSRSYSFIDQFAATRSVETQIMVDGIHPNNAGFEIMFNKIKESIDNAE